MNNAELHALRNLLFLSVEEAAEHIGGVTRRSWFYWEAGKWPVPDDVADKLRALLLIRAQMIEGMEAGIAQQTAAAHPDDEPFVLWHTPESWATATGSMKKPPDLSDLALLRAHQSAAAEVLARDARVRLAAPPSP